MCSSELSSTADFQSHCANGKWDYRSVACIPDLILRLSLLFVVPLRQIVIAFVQHSVRLLISDHVHPECACACKMHLKSDADIDNVPNRSCADMHAIVCRMNWAHTTHIIYNHIKTTEHMSPRGIFHLRITPTPTKYRIKFQITSGKKPLFRVHCRTIYATAQRINATYAKINHNIIHIKLANERAHPAAIRMIQYLSRMRPRSASAR